MTDKPHKKDTNATPDVPADNPEGTMDRFRDGLRRVLTAPKRSPRAETTTPARKRPT
jgi:hypothetical protein